MRTIQTGRGVACTELAPADIAGRRSMLLDSFAERNLFRATFARVRTIAPPMAHLPLDLEMVCTEFTRHSSVMEAAMIEALASLRAEGVRI